MTMSNYILSREAQEQHESERLARYAVISSASLGREHPEPEHQYRSCFQRDRDRIIHSAAFRRLEAKTQVFLDTAGDYYRTRLTHTIEVAQIARTMARVLSLNEDLAEAAGLAHDLGHPPYGHAGEIILNELLGEYGGFEHNRQSLRIVRYLEHPYPSFRGLNLTYETRECLAKHETRYDKPDNPNDYLPGHAPLEGQIADLADAIAYNSHDLDDALACNLIREDDLADVRLYQAVKRNVFAHFPQAHRVARQLRCAKGVIDILIQDTLAETADRLERFAPADLEHIRRAPMKIVALSDSCREELTELQTFLMQNVYQHSQVIQAQDRARRELEHLFARYLREPSLLPRRYQERMNEQSPQLVICDYLAGMTDRFCHRLYQQLS